MPNLMPDASAPEAGPAETNETDAPARPRKRSFRIAGHATSLSLEDAFWRALREIADADGRSVASLVAEIDRGRGGSNLSSAVRVFVLHRFRSGL